MASSLKKKKLSNAINDSIYGKLYKWHVVETGKICPQGWRVPSTDDWIQLKEFLGDNAGGKLKEIGTEHWLDPNVDATDEYGFTALPAMFRWHNGEFSIITYTGQGAIWWSSTLDQKTGWPMKAQLFTFNGHLNISRHIPDKGYSIRCIKN